MEPRGDYEHVTGTWVRHPWTLQGTKYVPRGPQTPKYHKKMTPRHQNITKQWSQNSTIKRKLSEISIPKSINQLINQSINQSIRRIPIPIKIRIPIQIQIPIKILILNSQTHQTHQTNQSQKSLMPFSDCHSRPGGMREAIE